MSIEMDRTYQSDYRLRDDIIDQDRSFRLHYRDHPSRSSRPSRLNNYRSRPENYSREYSYDAPSLSSTTYRSPSYYNSSSALPYNEPNRDDYTAIPTNYRRESSSRSIEESSSYGYREDEYRSSPSTCSLTFLSMRSEPYGTNSSTSDRYPRNNSNHRSDISFQRNNHGSDYHNSSVNSRSSYSSPSSSVGLRRDHSHRSSRDYHQIEPSRYSADYHFYPSIKRSRSRYDIDDELRPPKRR